MAKTEPLSDELIFLDVLPELHPEFIERVRNERKISKTSPNVSPNKKQ